MIQQLNQIPSITQLVIAQLPEKQKKERRHMASTPIVARETEKGKETPSSNQSQQKQRICSTKKFTSLT
jgi:hypothetical protein